jgi:hypothetical protein
MGDMNFPDPSASPHESWEWDGEKWAKIMEPGVPETTAIASGVMATGDMVIVNADGTVSIIKETVTPGGDMPAELGGRVQFLGKSARYISTTYDTNSGKAVVTYRDRSSNFGTAITGEIVGDTIVFGAPVIFHSASCSSTSVCFDQSSGKVVIAFTGYSDNNVRAVAGEVSGDTILLDSPVLIDSGVTGNASATYNPSVEKVVIAYGLSTNGGKAVAGSIVNGTLSFGQKSSFQTTAISSVRSGYDPISEKTIIAYADGGGFGKAVVAEIAGTTNPLIAFGTPVVFHNGGISFPSLAYDHESKKMVIAYNGDRGRLVVGTVSGDTMSFGAPVNFSSSQTTGVIAGSDPVWGKVVIAYGEASSNQSLVRTGKVSGDSVTFEDALQFNGSPINHSALFFEPPAEKFGLFYSDDTSGDPNGKGYGRVYSPGGKSPDIVDTNLTSENFIGVSKADYADGDEATVQIAGINADQQGMTVGKQYVQPDGSLDTTEGTPSVLAGTALSATELNIKDLL